MYLGEFKSHDDAIDGTMELTQGGIAAAIGTPRGNVPRAINRLMKKQLVNSKKVHIPGARQKRMIYYLTPKGRKESEKTRQTAMKFQIPTLDAHGNELVMTPQEIHTQLLQDYPLNEILCSPLINGLFDCREFMKQKSRRGEPAEKQVKSDANGRHFHGREAEMVSIREWLKSDSINTLVVKGMPGIGKSTLMANAMGQMSREHSVHFININTWCSMRQIIQSLADSFGELGFNEPKAYLREQPDIAMHDMEYMLARILSENKSILIFDNFQNVTRPLQEFFSMLKSVVDESNGSKLAILGRDAEPFYERSTAAGTVMEITLEGLSETGLRALAKSFGLPENRMEKIMAQTGGHPLFVELLAHGSGQSNNVNMERYIAEEFVHTLTREEVRLLKFISVFRFPVERSALRSHQPALFGLLKKFILKQSEDGFIILHDIIRDAFYRQLSRAELRRLHPMAARHYLGMATASGQLEAVHHFLCAEQPGTAAELMLTKLEIMMNTGNMEYLAKLLTMLLCSELDITPAGKAALMHAQGTALTFIGEMDSAMENLERAVELAESVGGMRTAMKAKLGIAKLMLYRNEYRESEPLFREILRWARKAKDPDIEAEVNYQLGAIYERLNVPEQALEHYRKAWEISIGTNDKKQQAQALYGMGRIYHIGRKFEKSLENRFKALDIALASGNEHLASKIITGIGRTQNEMGLLDECIITSERAISLSRKSGSIRVLAYALSNGGAAYIDRPNLVQASEYLDEALRLFERIGDRRMIATVKLNMASIKILRGKFREGMDAFREVRIILEALEDKNELLIAYFKFGQAVRKVDKLEHAMKLYKKALHISEELSDSDASEQIRLEMQDLYDTP